MNRIIGIPANGPELSDTISDHFGHCAWFVGVELTDGTDMKKVFALENNGHSSCMEPVINMKDRKVSDMIVGGIGGRPYNGFIEMGISLFQGVSGTIQQNISLLMQGKLKGLGGPHCSGGEQHYAESQ